MQLINKPTVKREMFKLLRFYDNETICVTESGHLVVEIKHDNDGDFIFAKIAVLKGYEWRKYRLNGACVMCGDPCEHDLLFVNKTITH